MVEKKGYWCRCNKPLVPLLVNISFSEDVINCVIHKVQGSRGEVFKLLVMSNQQFKTIIKWQETQLDTVHHSSKLLGINKVLSNA